MAQLGKLGLDAAGSRCGCSSIGYFLVVPGAAAPVDVEVPQLLRDELHHLAQHVVDGDLLG